MVTKRRTQSERTDATTALLIDATVTALIEVGYKGATTTEIAARAGVSRGAMLHHFPHRADLFAAVADRLTDAHIERFEQSMADVAGRDDKLDIAIDVLWEICSSPVNVAWMEFAAAAHHELALTATVAVSGARMRERTRATWEATFPELQSGEYASVAPDFALSLLEGLAMSQRSAPDPAVASSVIDGLKRLSVLITLPTEQP